MDKSPDGVIEINLLESFERIFSKNIITMLFGADISDETFEVYLEDVRGSKNFVKKKVNIAEAFFEGKILLMQTVAVKFLNPLNLLWRYTHKLFNASSLEKINVSNCQKARNFIMQYVKDRRAGIRKS